MEQWQQQRQNRPDQAAADNEDVSQRLASAVAAILGEDIHPSGRTAPGRITVETRGVSLIYKFLDSAETQVGIVYGCPQCYKELTAPVAGREDVERIIEQGYPKHEGCV